MTGWTPERRRQQSEQIHRWKPWEKSTGPRTAKGKATTAEMPSRVGRDPCYECLRKSCDSSARSKEALKN